MRALLFNLMTLAGIRYNPERNLSESEFIVF
jgi:hypothetical protein